MAESNKCLLNHDLQNDDNASDTEEIDEDNIELDVTCLASPSIEQFLDDERENQINERYQRASGVGRIVVVQTQVLESFSSSLDCIIT